MFGRLAILGLVLQLGACNAPDGTLESASRAVFAGPSWTEVMDAAELTMREFFPIDRVDREAGLIQALPAADAAAPRSAAIGPGLSSPVEIRKVAQLQVTRRAGSFEAACRVFIQQNQEAEARPYLQQSSGDDVPNQTPLEEGLGLDTSPGVTWNTVGRDRRLEQSVLAALQERLEK